MTDAATPLSRQETTIEPVDRGLTRLRAELARTQAALREETARRAHAEDALRAHQDRFATLGAGGIATFDWHLDGRPSVWSRELEALYGFPPGGYDGTYDTWFNLIHPDDRPDTSARIASGLETGHLLIEFRAVWPDESVHWLQCRGRTHYGPDGSPTRVVGVTIDLTQLKRSEAALRSSEELFARAFRSSPDAIAVSRRADGRLIEVNDRWQSMFGYAREQAIGRAPSELGIYANDEDRRRIWAEIDEHGGVQGFEYGFRAGTGDLRRGIISIEPVDLGGEPCLITIVRDVTAQRQAEAQVEEQRQQLAQLNRVVTLGALSGALAHELQQPLTAILANTEAAARLLTRDPLDVEELRAIVYDIGISDRRASDVITRLRVMMQRRPTMMAPVDANRLVDDVLEIARRDLVHRNVSVQVRADPSQPAVLGDCIQMQQVLLNLVLNACEAMRAVDPPLRQLTIASTAIEPNAVQLSVTDRGHGIASEWMPHLFQPFFTSKEEGLGLGLAISRTIVDAHGGRLWAENNPDGGASFHLVLRRVEAGDPAGATASA